MRYPVRLLISLDAPEAGLGTLEKIFEFELLNGIYPFFIRIGIRIIPHLPSSLHYEGHCTSASNSDLVLIYWVVFMQV
jgi:hypothetical protein